MAPMFTSSLDVQYTNKRLIPRQMASYKVVEVYTDITDCTLHCRVQFFLSCVEHSHSFLMSVRLVCSKVYLLYTCQCCVEV